MQNRRIMGIGRVNLVAKTIDLTPIGPAEGVGFALAPDRKRGYGLLQQIGRYEFWAFDVAQKKLLSRTPSKAARAWRCACRRTASCSTSSRPARRSTSTTPRRTKYLRTIEMDADQTTNLFILPKAAATNPTGR